MDPQILVSTPEWIGVNKPPGWLSIPARDSAPCLSDWFSAQFPNEKIFVVHRIDRETSGAVLFARTALAHKKAGIWFERHQVKKTYDCLTLGQPRLPTFRVDTPIEGKKAVSQIEIIRKSDAVFQAQVRIVTGRRHQIRIHLSGLGYPVLGDLKYKGPRKVEIGQEWMTFARVALYAFRLELPDGLVLEASWPVDFKSWVERLFP
ncbi:RNA pseudouridine synthase [Bdellovibrionota bacterium FG-2]